MNGIAVKSTAEHPSSTMSVNGSMKVDLLDYSGHPCQVQLSKALAARGHSVRHLYCPDYVSGKGALHRRVDDPPTFSVHAVSLGHEFKRYSPVVRLWDEIRFGLAAARTVLSQRPDVVVLSNVPLLAHYVLASRLSRARIPTVFWQQDVYSRAIAVSAERRLGMLGRLIGYIADRIESSVAHRSAGVVAIADAFVPTLRRWKVRESLVDVIPNWAPLDEMPCLSKRNDWASIHDLDERSVVLYSGTLGLKHDPSVLLRIAHLLRDEQPEARLVVVSEGAGRSWLQPFATPNLPQLVLLDFQPYEILPQVLASADVLVALLEPAAGVFSVPSKTLNYMCAGRPTLCVMPSFNAAAQVIAETGAGLVVAPGDGPGLDEAIRSLLADEPRRGEMGKRARAHAESTFNIDNIVRRFEARIAMARVA